MHQAGLLLTIVHSCSCRNSWHSPAHNTAGLVCLFLYVSSATPINLACHSAELSNTACQLGAPIGHDSCACHTTKPEVRSQCACSKSAGLHPNSVCQLGCTYQIPHGTELTLSGKDMPRQMQSRCTKFGHICCVEVGCAALSSSSNDV